MILYAETIDDEETLWSLQDNGNQVMISTFRLGQRTGFLWCCNNDLFEKMAIRMVQSHINQSK